MRTFSSLFRYHIVFSSFELSCSLHPQLIGESRVLDRFLRVISYLTVLFPLRAPAYPAQFITSLAFRAPVVSFVLLSSKYSIISEISCSTILWPMFRQWRWSLLSLATSPDVRNHNASNRCAPSPLCFAIISFFPLLYPKSRNS